MTAALDPGEDPLVATIATYDRVRRSHGAPTRSHTEAFARRLSHGVRVLDAGCGAGEDLAVFSAHGMAVVGLDLSAGMCAKARIHAPVTRGDLRSLPFQGGAFDAVWLSAALVHLGPEDTVAALREVHRVLDPCGIAAGSVKQRRDDEDPGRWVEDQVGRRWFWFHTARELTALLASAGLEAVVTEQEDAERAEVSWLHFEARRVK